LSVTGWQLTFMRSAKNAEFSVPQVWVDQAISYVARLWDPRSGVFSYKIKDGIGMEATRGTAGAGILCLSMAGQHQTPMAIAAGDWLLMHRFNRIHDSRFKGTRFFYGA